MAIGAQAPSAHGPATPAAQAPDQPWDGRAWTSESGSVHGTPPRRPGSVRRTTSIYMTRPEGFTSGPLHLVGTGRDLLTAADGSTRVLGTATLRIIAEGASFERPVIEISAQPDLPGLQELVGRSSRVGFRSAVRDTVGPALAGADAAPVTDLSLLAQLLDDIPVAVLVSNAAKTRATGRKIAAAKRPPGATVRVDVCAGWRADGLIMSSSRFATERVIPPAPPAGRLVLDGDPLAWHDLPPLPVTGMRRLRRIDVTPVRVPAQGPAPEERAVGAAFMVDALFRDSYQEAEDAEVVIHEYALEAAAARDGRVVHSVTRPAVLPSSDCLAAVPSAGRIVGMALTEVRQTVARTFGGTSTCTHLNDMLRSIGDLPVLVRALEQSAS